MVMGAERTTTTFLELPLELAELLAELVELPLELTELPQEPDRSLGESKLPFFCIRSKLPELVRPLSFGASEPSKLPFRLLCPSFSCFEASLSLCFELLAAFSFASFASFLSSTWFPSFLSFGKPVSPPCCSSMLNPTVLFSFFTFFFNLFLGRTIIEVDNALDVGVK